MLRLAPVITTLALALSGCAAKKADPPAPKTYSKATNADICARIDFGLLQQVFSDLSTGQDKDTVTERGVSCTRHAVNNPIFSTVFVGVGIHDDAAGAARVHEEDVKRYAIDIRQLPALSPGVEKAVLTSNRPGDDWLYLADGNMSIIIHFAGGFPRGDAETARLLEAEVRFTENVISRIREELLK